MIAKKITSNNDLIFVIAMWFLSRMVIVVTMQVITPFLVPNFLLQPHDPATIGWESFANWDGDWYRKIVTSGYEYANDGKQHNIAFFPLFPLITRAVMSLGLPYAAAGSIVNSLALLGALIIVYFWVKKRHGIAAARWSTVVLAWCPFSLFSTVTYSEGVFLFLTTASLRAFEKRQHVWASVWGGLATATRANGVALIPTFLFVAWREKRSARAYIAAIATSTGLMLFILYCAVKFGDPLAFVHAQRAWQEPGFNLNAWWNLFTKDLLLRRGIDRAYEALTKITMIFGGGYLLWRFRAKLSLVIVIYGFCSLALIVNSGAIRSMERFVYGTVSMSIALGLLLSLYPRWRYPTVGFFALWLAYFSVRFSWKLWVG